MKDQDLDLIVVSYDSIWKSPHFTDYRFAFSFWWFKCFVGLKTSHFIPFTPCPAGVKRTFERLYLIFVSLL